MSLDKDGVFLRIVEEGFSEDEQAVLRHESNLADSRTGPYVLEPVYFGREDLLTAFHEVLDWSEADKRADEWPALIARFCEKIVLSLDIEPGDRMLVQRPRVLLLDDEPVVLSGEDRVTGTFASLIAERLYFVDQVDNWEDPILRSTGKTGLYTVLKEAYIETEGEIVPIEDEVLVSLHNGVPDLYKRLSM